MNSETTYERVTLNRLLQHECHMHAAARGLYQGLPCTIRDQAESLVIRVQDELQEALKAAQRMVAGDTRELGEEMADVVICCMSVCQQLGIDLPRYIENKNRYNANRHFEDHVQEDA